MIGLVELDWSQKYTRNTPHVADVGLEGWEKIFQGVVFANPRKIELAHIASRSKDLEYLADWKPRQVDQDFPPIRYGI